MYNPPPLHVVKVSTEDNYCFIHFQHESQAATFYARYCLQQKMICRQLLGATVRPSLQENGSPTSYVS